MYAWGLLLTAVPFLLVTGVDCSSGDRSYKYQKCLWECKQSKCSHVTDEAYMAEHPAPMRWFYWTCPADCEYSCMWKTVHAFELDGSGVPQFHGKWPFVRLWGIQEPASTLFSFLNGLAHFTMLMKFRKSVPSSAPMYCLWHIYALIAVNAWLWAVVFHTRDFQFTELMDYMCAISLVLSSLFMLSVRLLGPSRKWLWFPVGLGILGYFVYHVHYMAYVSFDYGYNMKANVFVGFLSAAGWVIWGIRNRHKQPYVWKAVACIISLNCLVLLEVGDFPPLWWTFDAHSLWHLGTVPIPFLWYSFVIDDSLYMLKQPSYTSLKKQDTGSGRLPVTNKIKREKVS